MLRGRNRPVDGFPSCFVRRRPVYVVSSSIVSQGVGHHVRRGVQQQHREGEHRFPCCRALRRPAVAGPSAPISGTRNGGTCPCDGDFDPDIVRTDFRKQRAETPPIHRIGGVSAFGGSGDGDGHRSRCPGVPTPKLVEACEYGRREPGRGSVGHWRSLAARLSGGQEAIGSNPVCPTEPLPGSRRRKIARTVPGRASRWRT